VTQLDRLFTAVSDFPFDVSSEFVAGDGTAAEWTISGTCSNDFHELLLTTGHRISFRSASVFDLVDGKIHYYTKYWDAYIFLVPVAAVPATEAAGTPVP
jgi:predicted ester cyclase